MQFDPRTGLISLPPISPAQAKQVADLVDDLAINASDNAENLSEAIDLGETLGLNMSDHIITGEAHQSHDIGVDVTGAAI